MVTEGPPLLLSEDSRVEPALLPSPGTWGNGFGDDNQRASSTTQGVAGLLRIVTADVAPPMTLRLAVSFEGYRGLDFPLPGVATSRQLGALSVAFTPLKGLEGYFAFGLAAAYSSETIPHLLQSQGDMAVGAKWALRFTRGLLAAADARVLLYPGLGESGLGAKGVAGRLVATYDARAHGLPARLHLNAGIHFDDTRKLAAAAPGGLTIPEEFALGVHAFNRAPVGLGLDAPLPLATPFVEYQAWLPAGSGLTGLPFWTRVDHGLAAGLRVTAPRSLTISIAGELGLSRFVYTGAPLTPPWAVVAGLSYDLDLLARTGTRVIERRFERERRVVFAAPPPPPPAAPTTGRIEGAVLDAATRGPIPGAVVAISSLAGPIAIMPVASDVAGGRFATCELPAGRAEVTVTKEGYNPASAVVEVAAGSAAQALLTLERAARPALLRVAVKSAGKALPVEATVRLDGPQPALLGTTGGQAESAVAHGRYAVLASAPGYLAKVRDLDLAEGATVVTDFDLTPEPKRTVIVIKEKSITLTKQIRFVSGKATIFPDSLRILDEVIDALIRKGVHRLRVEGHTDNVGGAARNEKLSQARADSVREYLLAQGIAADRVEAMGYGPSRPVAPNFTLKGRQLNRRVEFQILE